MKFRTLCFPLPLRRPGAPRGRLQARPALALLRARPLLAQRALKALRWLAELPIAYERIAVVSHKHFLGALTGLYPETVAQRAFENAERRTVLMCVGDGSTERETVTDGAGAVVKPTQARVKPLGQVER